MAQYKILHLIDSLGIGGAQEVLFNLVRHADRAIFAPEVAVLHGRGPFWDKFEALDIPLHSLSPSKVLPLYIPKLLWLLLGKRYDLVVTHLDASIVLGQPLAALARVPVRFSYNHCNPTYLLDSPLAFFLQKTAQKCSTHLIAVSASTRDFLVHNEGVSSDRVFVVLSMVDMERFRPDPDLTAGARSQWNIPEAAPVVCGVGRLRSQKHFSLFLRVAARVLEALPDAVFLIAGTGPEEKNLKRKARTLGLGDAVRFLGSFAEVEKVYAAADVFLLTSRFEGTPMVALEAMAMELPVVASKVDGTAEILDDGRDAFLVPPGEEEIFVQRLLSLLRDKALARNFAKTAREKATATHSAPAKAGEVEALFLRQLKGISGRGHG